jgi:thioredoxin 1
MREGNAIMKTVSKRGLWIIAAGVVAGVWASSSDKRELGGVCCPLVASMSAMAGEAAPSGTNAAAMAKLPRLVDLGADKCIPCKAMAPILKELKAQYAGRMDVEFIDVWKNPDVGKANKIQIIPTQIFFAATGQELYRHEGFFGKEDILGKWKELGIELKGKGSAGIVRETAVAADTRPRESVCFMCDGDVNVQTRTMVKGQSEQRVLCGPHCYFIYFSSLVGADPKAEESKVSVTDCASGNAISGSRASYRYGLDSKGRPTVKAFADQGSAAKEQQTSPGNMVTWEVLRSKELATRCAFCDRAVYPEDACGVKIGTTRGYGCCTHCSMGVAARLKQDIEVEAKDGLTGELIRVQTLDGQIASLEPATATAWFGQVKDHSGKWASAGCFKQAFFVSEANLKKWLEARPAMTGRQITIAQVLADKMKLSPEQIARACKLGDCK